MMRSIIRLRVKFQIIPQAMSGQEALILAETVIGHLLLPNWILLFILPTLAVLLPYQPLG